MPQPTVVGGKHYVFRSSGGPLFVRLHLFHLFYTCLHLFTRFLFS